MLTEVSNWRRPPPGLILPSWYPRPERPRHRRKQEGILWVPNKGVLRAESNMGAVGAATPGTSVTTGAGSSTKGTAVQLIASTAFDAYFVKICVSNVGLSATSSATAVDLLIGAATEEVIIPNMLAGSAGAWGAASRGAKVWEFPLYIPAGSRIAAQAASQRTSTAIRVGIWLYGGTASPPFQVGSEVTTYGIGTVPQGATVTVGGSGVEGAWAQMTASTSLDHFALIPSFQTSGDTAMINSAIQVDVGMGAATEEQLGDGYWFSTDTTEMMDGPVNAMPTFCDIPAGQRLVMRASASGGADVSNGAIHAVT